MPAYQEPSPWTPIRVQQIIDPILLGDRRVSISSEMQKRSLAAKNAAKSPAQWADAEVKLADEWAEKSFAAWIETWDEQGLPRCHALYRVVYDWELIQHFAGRNSYFQGESQRLELLKRQPNFYSGARQWFASKMSDLARNWDRRMNVESRRAMYAARGEGKALTASQVAVPRPLDAAGASATVSGAAPQNGAAKRPGRPRMRSREFEAFARGLWSKEMKGVKRVSPDGLRRIASHLNSSDFKKPSDYLEKKAAKALRHHNQKWANSPAGKIMTWTALADSREFVRAMRDLLSRCACNIRK